MERIIVINLKEAYKKPTSKRLKYAANLLRKLIARYTKVDEDKVKISNSLNSLIFSRKSDKPPRKVKVYITGDENEIYARLPEEKVEVKEVKEKPKEKEKTEKKVEKTEVKEKWEEEKVGKEEKVEGEKQKVRFDVKSVEKASERE